MWKFKQKIRTDFDDVIDKIMEQRQKDGDKSTLITWHQLDMVKHDREYSFPVLEKGKPIRYEPL